MAVILTLNDGQGMNFYHMLLEVLLFFNCITFTKTLQDFGHKVANSSKSEVNFRLKLIWESKFLFFTFVRLNLVSSLLYKINFYTREVYF